MGGGGSVNIETGRECQWTAAAETSWLTVAAGAAGQGPSTVPFSVAANPVPSVRRGTIAVNGQRVEITQAAAACTMSLSTREVSVGATGGTASVAIVTQDPCTWTAASREPWITVTSRTSGAGSTEVVFEAAANSGVAREGIVEIAGQQVTVSQTAPALECSFTIAPPSAAVGASASQITVTVAAAPGCAWSTSGAPSWITVSNGNGSGNGTVTLSVQNNTGATRSATVTVAGRPLVLDQAAAGSPLPPAPPPPAPAPSCAYAINPTSHSASAAGGNTSVAVTTTAGCSWTTAGVPAWITLTTGTGAGAGSGAVNLTVGVNSGTARTATLTIGGQSFTVNQAAAAAPPPPCSYTVTPQTFTIGNDERSGDQALLVTVVTGLQCAWTSTVAPGTSWLTIRSGATGTGSGAVLIEVERNRGKARSGTLTIAGRTVTINQEKD